MLICCPVGTGKNFHWLFFPVSLFRLSFALRSNSLRWIILRLLVWQFSTEFYWRLRALPIRVSPGAPLPSLVRSRPETEGMLVASSLTTTS